MTIQGPLLTSWLTKPGLTRAPLPPLYMSAGANQALEDGPLLASWLTKPGLTRGNVVTRLRCFERNMVWDLYGRVWMGEYHVSTALTRPPPLLSPPQHIPLATALHGSRQIACCTQS